MITYEEFKKIELRTVVVRNAERVEGSEKLLRLEVCDGKLETGEDRMRQIVAGVGKKYEPEALIGKTIIIVANLEPRSLMGLESQGMLLAASNENEGPILLTTMSDIIPGSEIK